MQIKKQDDKELLLISRESKAILADHLQLGELKITNNGEYEVGGILAHCLAPNICLLQVEGITIAYLDFTRGEVSDSRLEQLSSADVAIYKVSADSAAKAASSVSGVDPRVVVAFDGEGLDLFFRRAGLSPVETTSLRLAAAGLPPTERIAYVIK